jgi:small conductance mechanosensitive channel
MPPYSDGIWKLPLLARTPDALRPILERGGQLLLLVVLFLVLRWVLGRLVNRAVQALAARDAEAGNESRAARVRTLGSLIKSVLFYTLAFVFFVTALGIVGFPVASVLGTAGVAGLAVGFGAQKLVKDVISGFFLLLEDQYAVGDYVTINGVTGTVEELGMRITRLRDDDGRLFILSNGDIGQVCNQSRGPLGGLFEVTVAASADIGKVTGVLNDAFATAARGEDPGVDEPARVDGISAADAAKTVLRVRFRTEPSRRPGDVAARLRQVARDALLTAEIPLA